MNEKAGPADEVKMTWHGLYRHRLVDLGQLHGDPTLNEVYSPRYERAEVAQFMSEHYESLEKARKQATYLDLRAYYKCHLAECFERIGFLPLQSEGMLALELGCGFGSATFPLLEVMPSAFVIASEFSTAMLTVLNEKLSEEPQTIRHRCGLLQLNAEALDFEDQSFDIVLGAAILHHLFHPESVLEGCQRILKTGGHAIFFEPFESGFSIVNIIYKTFLAEMSVHSCPSDVRQYLEYSSAYWDSMTHLPKDDAFFKGADDKWLFTSGFFETHAKRLGFRQCLTFSMSKSDRPFEELIRTHFKGNRMPEPAPWMMKIIDRFEGSFSPMMKQELFTEGVLVLTK